MTAVGKILVFLNLVFSVTTAGLIVIVFSTRTNWKSEYEKVRNLALVAEANYKSQKMARGSDVSGRDSQNITQANDNKELDETSKAKDIELKKVKDDSDKKSVVITSLNTNLTAQVQELAALRAERDELVKDREVVRAKVLEVQKDRDDQRLLAVNNKIEADAQTGKANRLLNRVEELERSNVAMQNRLNALGATVASSNQSILSPAPPPPPRDVKGTVKAVATSGLTVINIGSDSGISAGNKLEIYRIDAQNPKNSIYLGEVVIGRTEPKQSVGQFYPKPYAKADERLPKANDIASTSLGSR